MTTPVTPSGRPAALVVDDLRFNRTLLRHTLANLHYDVVEAADGGEAIRHLSGQSFAVVFLDWELPGELKGDHVAAHLRALPRQHTLLIAITSDDSDAMRRRCEQAGVDAFLAKALDSASVRNALLAASARHATRSPEGPDRIGGPLLGFASLFPGGLGEALRHCSAELDAERRRRERQLGRVRPGRPQPRRPLRPRRPAGNARRRQARRSRPATAQSGRDSGRPRRDRSRRGQGLRGALDLRRHPHVPVQVNPFSRA